MTRRLLICLLALVMVSHTTGCTSGGGSGDSEVAESNDETFAEEGEGDFADDSTAVADDSATTEDSVAEESTTDTDTAVADGAPADDAGDDLSLDGGSDVAADSTTETTTTTESTDVAGGDTAAPSDDLSLDDPASSALPDDVASTTEPENITENPAAPSDAGVFEDPSAQASAAPPEPAPVDTTPAAPSDTASSGFSDQGSSPSAPVASSAPAVYSPYLKVKDAAYTAASGETLNRVYLARPRDNAKGIAQKVYGDPSRSKDLVKWNPIMKRGVRTGDKIYYTSTANPSDTRMLTYYEEAGIPAMTYVAKDSDNFRETAKSLLGFKDAWKEVYATNANLSDKSGRIPTGLELRYWGDAAAPAPATPVTTAQTDMPAGPDAGMPSALPDAAPQVQPPVDVAANTAPPSDPFAQTPPNVATNGAPTGADPMAPPPPMGDDPTANGTAGAAASVAAGGTDPMAPPPMPPTETAVAPPAPKPVVKRAAVVEEADGMDADTTMALGVGGVLLLAAAILFVVIRKKRATRMDLGQTQV